MNPDLRYRLLQTRRTFLKQSSLGAIAWASMRGEAVNASPSDNPFAPKPSMFPAKAKSVIYLHMSGAPPQHELFDYKPKLVALHMQPCPDELLKNQRFAFIKGHPKLLGTPY